MKRFLLTVLALCGVMVAAEDFKVVKNVSFLGKERVEKLDLYLPAGQGTLRPAVVMIHGGSWRQGAKDTAREINICTNLAKQGFVAASIEYKLVKNGVAVWPTNLNDCRDAVRFLRAHAEKYQINPERIGVIGASAGGHLALMLALTPEKERIDAASHYPGVSCQVSCCINMYGFTEHSREGVSQSFDTMLGVPVDDAVLQRALPVRQARKDAPPVLTIHGTADKTVDFRHAVALDEALKKCGASSELLLLKNVDHMFNMEYDKDGKALPVAVKTTMLRFLEKHLK